MAASYNSFYQTENLFGDPYPELIDFFANYPDKEYVFEDRETGHRSKSAYRMIIVQK